MTDKMREVPPITDETYKALMVALGMPNNRSLLSALQQIANHATQRAAWQAEQAVPAVTLHAEQIRIAAVSAIREVTGCPDLRGKDGTYLVDTLIYNIMEMQNDAAIAAKGEKE